MERKETDTIGQFIKNLRTEKAETLHQVSKATDIDMTMLSKIERGERLPTTEQVRKMAAYFILSENELQTKLTAERIIKEYGINETTYNAIKMVEEHLIPYLNKLSNS